MRAFEVYPGYLSGRSNLILHGLRTPSQVLWTSASGFLLALVLLAGWVGASTPALAGAQPADLWVKGRLEPRRHVSLSVTAPARIEQVLVAEGADVSAGEVLARLDGYEARSAEVAAAELELVLAQQTLDELGRSAGLRLAEATLALRQAEKDRAFAADHLASLQRPKPALNIQAAKANLLLAEMRLADVREDLRRAQHLYADRDDIVWLFLNRRPYRLYLASLEVIVAYAERRYWDASEKVQDLQKPPDEIDVQVAAAELQDAEARLHEATRQRDELLSDPGNLRAGATPDPDEWASAQARLSAAQARLAAALAGLRLSELRTPISGVVVDLAVKPGEFAWPAQHQAVVADLSDWVVIVDELGESSVAQLAAGQPVTMSLDAYPGAELQGVVETVGGYPREEEGEVYYRAQIGMNEADIPVRWGMTARVELADR